MSLEYNWAGENPASPRHPMAVRISGGQSFIDAPFLVRVATGELEGWDLIHKFARNSDIGNTAEDIWEPGGTMVYPTAQDTLSIVSDDADDTAAGSGAQEVTIHGLDLLLAEIEETIALDGLTPVVTTLEFYRVNHVDVTAAGSSGYNEGSITVSHSGNPISYIGVDSSGNGEGHDHCCHFTVPAGKIAMIMGCQFWQGKDSPQDASMWHRHNTTGVWHMDFHALSYRIQTSIDMSMASKYGGGGLEAGVDFKLTSAKDGAGANVDVTGRYNLLLKDISV